MQVVRMVGIGCLLGLVGGACRVQAAETAVDAATPAVTTVAAQGAIPSAVVPAAAPSASDLARRHQRDRLAGEIDRLQEQITDLPADLDQRSRAVTAQRDDLGYEGWLIDAEGDQVRTSIDTLRVRLTLLEDITRSQDQLDRVRMVELQNALTDINTDAAHLSLAQRRAQEELTAIARQQAARAATFERLAEVHRQLERLLPPAPVVAAPLTTAPPLPTATEPVPSVPSLPAAPVAPGAAH